jgi:hypothetical protein
MKLFSHLLLDSGGSGLDEDEIRPAVERTPLRRNTRALSSPMLVKFGPFHEIIMEFFKLNIALLQVFYLISYGKYLDYYFNSS